MTNRTPRGAEVLVLVDAVDNYGRDRKAFATKTITAANSTSVVFSDGSTEEVANLPAPAQTVAAWLLSPAGRSRL